MRTASYTDLKNNLKGFLDGVVNDSEPLIVNRAANASVVIVPIDEWNAINETEYLMSSSEMVKRIKEAEKEMHEGKGKVISVEDLWK